MIVYSGLKNDFLHSVEMDTLAAEIEQNVFQKLGRRTVTNEFASWINSYGYMYKVINDSDIPEDAGIAIEYNIPQTAKDAMYTAQMLEWQIIYADALMPMQIV